ncbi:hypothetical protein TKK_0016412 [Trichogramma kaykai]
MFGQFFIVLLVVHSSLGSYFSCYTEVRKGSSKDGTVKHGINLEVTYARDNLLIYPHPLTKYVNVLNDQLKITVKDDEASETSSKSQFSAVIEGYATLNHDKTLRDCHLKIKTLAMLDVLDHKSFRMLKPCIESTFCEQQDKVTDEDYLRASLHKHNFGDDAATIIEILKRNRDAATSFENRNDTQSTLNLIFDQTLTAIIHGLTAKRNGILTLPDVSINKNGVMQQIFELTNGTLEGLKDTHRLNEVSISHNGVLFTVNFKIIIPYIHLKYEKLLYKAGIVPVVSNSLHADAKNIVVGIKMSLDYSKSPCEAALNLTEFNVEFIKLKSSENIDSYIRTTIINFVLENFKENFLGIIRAQLEALFTSVSQLVVCDIKMDVDMKPLIINENVDSTTPSAD